MGNSWDKESSSKTGSREYIEDDWQFYGGADNLPPLEVRGVEIPSAQAQAQAQRVGNNRHNPVNRRMETSNHELRQEEPIPLRVPSMPRNQLEGRPILPPIEENSANSSNLIRPNPPGQEKPASRHFVDRGEQYSARLSQRDSERSAKESSWFEDELPRIPPPLPLPPFMNAKPVEIPPPMELPQHILDDIEQSRRARGNAREQRQSRPEPELELSEIRRPMTEQTLESAFEIPETSAANRQNIEERKDEPPSQYEWPLKEKTPVKYYLRNPHHTSINPNHYRHLGAVPQLTFHETQGEQFIGEMAQNDEIRIMCRRIYETMGPHAPPPNGPTRDNLMNLLLYPLYLIWDENNRDIIQVEHALKECYDEHIEHFVERELDMSHHEFGDVTKHLWDEYARSEATKHSENSKELVLLDILKRAHSACSETASELKDLCDKVEASHRAGDGTRVPEIHRIADIIKRNDLKPDIEKGLRACYEIKSFLGDAVVPGEDPRRNDTGNH